MKAKATGDIDLTDWTLECQDALEKAVKPHIERISEKVAKHAFVMAQEALTIALNEEFSARIGPDGFVVEMLFQEHINPVTASFELFGLVYEQIDIRKGRAGKVTGDEERAYVSDLRAMLMRCVDMIDDAMMLPVE